MTSSHLNRIRNEIEDLEERSDKKVSPDSYYVVEILFMDIQPSEEKMSKWAKEIIKEDQPLFVYVRRKEMFVFYPPCEKGHLLKGSHQRICSNYSSIYTAKLSKEDLPSQTLCCLTELNNQHSVFGYLLWKNIETQFQRLSGLLDLPMVKIYQMTLQEAFDKAGKKWENSSKFEKYGTVYKLREKKGKTVLSSFSKSIDSRRCDHYLSYLFGRPEAH